MELLGYHFRTNSSAKRRFLQGNAKIYANCYFDDLFKEFFERNFNDFNLN